MDEDAMPLAVTAVGDKERTATGLLPWHSVRAWRKAMQEGRPFYRRSLAQMVHAMGTKTQLEAFEALTGTGKYAGYPHTCVVKYLTPPRQVRHKNGEQMMYEQVPGTGIPAQASYPQEQDTKQEGTPERTDVEAYLMRGLTVAWPKGVRMLSRDTVETIIRTLFREPRAKSTQVAAEVAVSDSSVDRVVQGLGSYAFLRADPWWQSLQGYLAQFGSDMRRAQVHRAAHVTRAQVAARVSGAPRYYTPRYNGEGDGVVLTSHDGDARVMVPGTMFTMPKPLSEDAEFMQQTGTESAQVVHSDQLSAQHQAILMLIEAHGGPEAFGLVSAAGASWQRDEIDAMRNTLVAMRDLVNATIADMLDRINRLA